MTIIILVVNMIDLISISWVHFIFMYTTYVNAQYNILNINLELVILQCVM